MSRRFPAVGIRQRIEDGLARPPGGGQAVAAQARQVLGDRRLAQARQFFQFPGAVLALREGAEHQQAFRMGEAPEKCRRRLGTGLHLVEIHNPAGQ